MLKIRVRVQFWHLWRTARSGTQWGSRDQPSISLLCVYKFYALGRLRLQALCASFLINVPTQSALSLSKWGTRGLSLPTMYRARALDWFYLSLILLNRRRRRQRQQTRTPLYARHKNLSAQFKDEQLFWLCGLGQNKRIAGRAPQESDGITSNSRHHARWLNFQFKFVLQGWRAGERAHAF